MKLHKVINLLIVFLFVLFFSASLHEFFHYIVGTALGGKGLYVTYPSFFTGLCQWPTPFPHMWLAYLAGGLGSGLVLLVLALRAVKTPTKWDADEAFIFSIFGGVGIGYGFAELSLAFPSTEHYFWWLSFIGCFIGGMPFAIWRGPKFVDFLLKDEAT
jgi:predicted acetyltransferase